MLLFITKNIEPNILSYRKMVFFFFQPTVIYLHTNGLQKSFRKHPNYSIHFPIFALYSKQK